METLETLKAKYGDVYTLTVKNKAGKEITVYLKELDRIIYKSTTALFQKDELTGVESLLKSLWIGGDDVNLITSDFTALRACSAPLAELLSVEQGSIKKN